MLNTLSHRGPDGSGCIYLHNGCVGLGHYRLSIIDLSEAGNQPMTNEDETVWLVFNGEIYNYPVLREKLISKGHAFRSNTDTEVIIHAYEEWGNDCIVYFRGIFAFGLWDERNQSLLLARDHLGVKPLYYWYNNRNFIFASQPRAIINNPNVPSKIDLSAFSDYLAYGYVPFNKAIYQGMAKLPAAHRLIIKDDHLTIENYWRINYTSLIHDEREALDLLQETLQETVSLQMISDVPVGSFLSGGIDSSGVTALMSKLSTESLQTFTVGFDEESSDERSFARIAADKFETSHHECVLTEEIGREMIYEFTEIYDEPFYDSSALPTYFVSQLTRSKKLKVVLSGDGGDELYAGYRWYDDFCSMMKMDRAERIKRWLQHLWRHSMEKTMKKSHNKAIGDYFSCVGFLDWEKQHALLTPSARNETGTDHLWLLRKFYRPDYPDITAAQYMDIHTYLVDDILTKVDRASMACGLEVRVPLLDHKMVELAFKIDCDLLYRNKIRKYILKKAFAKWVPSEILTVRKKGFSIPIRQWMKSYLQEWSLKALNDGSLVNQGIFKPNMMQDIMACGDSRVLWLLFAAELWARRWIEGCSMNEIRKLNNISI